MPRVVVVGLGPAGPDLVTTAALSAIEAIPRRYLRTTRHPSAGVVPDATSFDRIYEQGDTIEQVYRDIVDELVAAANDHGEVLYAVPGSPAVAEHTVELLLLDHEIEVEVIPALSFIDLAWTRLGVDPIAVGARIIDGHQFEVEAAGERGPLLVAQCDRVEVLSDIKLAVDESPSLPVTVLARLGLPDEEIIEVSWEDLDRAVDPDHLTSLWIPELAEPVAAEVKRFDEVVTRLRTECPWDREQTHQSLARHLLEETHEVLEVLGHMPPYAGTYGEPAPEGDEVDEAYDALEEELGDLLFQIVFHARLATEAGRFTLADVARRVHDKLVSRHPHVFNEEGIGQVEGLTEPLTEVDTAEDVVSNWEQIKAAEKGRDSVFDGIPKSLPALSYATKVIDRARRSGMGDAAQAAVETEIDQGSVEAEILTRVLDASRQGIDPELAVGAAISRVLERLRHHELSDGRDGQGDVASSESVPPDPL